MSSGFEINLSRYLADQTSPKLRLSTSSLPKAHLESLCQAAWSCAISRMEQLKDVDCLYGGINGTITEIEPQPGVVSRLPSVTARTETRAFPFYHGLGLGNVSPSLE